MELLEEAACFPKTGWNFDVAGHPDADHFRAKPQGIANVLERVRADDEVQFLVLERIGFLGADITYDPGLLREHFNRSTDGRNRVALCKCAVVEPPRLIGRQIQHIIRRLNGYAQPPMLRTTSLGRKSCMTASE